MTVMEATAGSEPVDGVAFFQNMLNNEAKDPPAKASAGPEPEEDEIEDDPAEAKEEPDQAADSDEEAEEVDEDNAKAEGEEAGEEGEEEAYDMSQAITIRLPDSDKEEKITLAELINGHMRQKDYTRKTQELAEARKALEQGQTQRQQLSEKAMQHELEIFDLQKRYNLIAASRTPDQWNELRLNDPADYAAQMTDLMQIGRALEYKQQERTAIQRHEMQEALAAKEKRIEEGNEVLSSRIPEWKDSAKREALQTEISQHLESFGFTPQEVKGLDDPRTVLISYESMLYRKMQGEKKNLTAKKLVTAPKTLKPGATKNKTEKAAETRKSVMEKVRKSGSSVEFFNQYG